MKPEPISLPVPEGSELLVNSDASARVRVQEVGDRAEQFAAFVDSVGPYLLHTAELLCGDKARPMDLVQATFERTYRSWSKARGRRPLGLRSPDPGEPAHRRLAAHPPRAPVGTR